MNALSSAVISPRVFEFDSHSIRTVDFNGVPWFVAQDVTEVIGIGNPSMALRALDIDEKGISSIDTPGGLQDLTIVNESGLFTLILRCRDATKSGSAPHRFRKWVTSEVLPAIARNGSYGRQDPAAMLNDPVALRGLLANYGERVIGLEHKVAEQAPKVELYDLIINTDHTLCLRDTAKLLKIKPITLTRFMNMHGWIHTRGGNPRWIAYQKRIDLGQLVHKLGVAVHSSDKEHAYQQVLVSMKGVEALAKHMGIQLVDGWRRQFA